MTQPESAAGLTAIADHIDELSPPDQLRLAASLLEERSPRIALAIIDKVSSELHVALAATARKEHR